LISLHGITKSYRFAEQQLSILKDVHLSIARGDSCGILGASGSGKSTLLNIIGLLDLPECGKYLFAGNDIFSAKPDELAAIRNQQIGFVFQSFNLLPRLSAMDNIALPLSYRGLTRHESVEQALRLLGQVGLGDRAHHRPADLSGGQRQRVAIARALVGKPSVILADEPTGNLDSTTAQEIMDLLLALNHEQQVTLIIVTHDAHIAERLERKILVRSGMVHEVGNL
jgi:putative ABC transport system ATP-binding protein